MTHLPHVSQIWDQGFLKQRFINIGNPGCHMCHDDWAWLAIISRRFVASEVKHNLICCIRRQTHESCCDLHSYIGAAYKSQHTDESHCSLPLVPRPGPDGRWLDKDIGRYAKQSDRDTNTSGKHCHNSFPRLITRLETIGNKQLEITNILSFQTTAINTA